ncbi:MAG: sugar transferase [Planctomycetota bacterium]|nr:MAG: sugar transferase [Planctomycetota bacterium]
MSPDDSHSERAPLLAESTPDLRAHGEAGRLAGSFPARLLRTARYLSSLPRQVLSAEEFERFLVRERELADRRTRSFSLLVLRRRHGSAEQFGVLALELRERLRSTDLVGRLDEQRIEVLLSDTDCDGANVVADWVDDLVTKLGIRVEPTIYVYPSVDGPDRGGPSSRPVEPPTRGGTAPTPNAGERTDGARASADRGSEPERSGRAGPRKLERWPMEDLWRHLALPLPAGKRALDLLLACAILLALLPLYAVVALAIRLDSPGPVLFRQMRAGLGGRPFVFYKFRSMRVDAEASRAQLEARNEQSGPIFKIENDPRITRVGHWLRRFSLDELPQLWNIVKGDLSLVGPRSPTLNEVPSYERWQRRRLDVTGGITCIWQVSGRSQIGFRDWMRMDMRYAARRRLGTDLWLLLRTLPAVLSGRGAY